MTVRAVASAVNAANAICSKQSHRFEIADCGKDAVDLCSTVTELKAFIKYFNGSTCKCWPVEDLIHTVAKAYATQFDENAEVAIEENIYTTYAVFDNIQHAVESIVMDGKFNHSF